MYRSASTPLRTPSIQPKDNASSTDSSQVKLGRPVPFLSCYTAVAAAGKKADKVATQLLVAVIKPLVNQSERLTLALVDTPTHRGLGMGPVRGGVGGPVGIAVGHSQPSSKSCRQAPGVAREFLGEKLRAVLHPGVTGAEIQAAAERLLSLAA